MVEGDVDVGEEPALLLVVVEDVEVVEHEVVVVVVVPVSHGHARSIVMTMVSSLRWLA